eukprot:m.32329 g.32329  ORF g.32329 m.32329 type:complete len:429 (+) comp14945_c0_seq1:212-1498(+)
MDQFVRKVLEGSEDPKALAKLLNKKEHEQALAKAGPHILQCFGAFDPAQHSLGLLEVLHHASKLPQGDSSDILEQIRIFLLHCTDHVRYSPLKFNALAKFFAEAYITRSQPIRALKPLRQALCVFSPSKDKLTPIHPIFVKCCILARHYRYCSFLFDQDVPIIDPSTTFLSMEDILLFFYYLGMAAIGNKKYHKALQSFSVVVSVPAEALSAIMVEAYKKYILVSLLLHGKVVPFPKYTSFVLRYLKQMTVPYHDFATAYTISSVAVLTEVLDKNLDTFQADKTLGLARQCRAKLYRRNIKQLTETFITLSLGDIADRVKLADADAAHRQLVSMIADGEIHAEINQKTGMVSFLDDPEQYNTTETVQLLNERTREAQRLHERVANLDIELQSSARYIRKQTLAQDTLGSLGLDNFDVLASMETLPSDM